MDKKWCSCKKDKKYGIVPENPSNAEERKKEPVIEPAKPPTFTVPVVYVWYRNEKGLRQCWIDHTFRPFIFVEETAPPLRVVLEEHLSSLTIEKDSKLSKLNGMMERRKEKLKKLGKKSSEVEIPKVLREFLKHVRSLERRVRKYEQVIGPKIESKEICMLPIPNGFKEYVAGNNHSQFSRTWSNIGIDNKAIKAITFVIPSETYEIRALYNKTYNAKVEFAYNYLVCKGITYGVNFENDNLAPCEPVEGVKPKLMHIDIEVDQKKQTYPMSDDPKYAIISVVVYDSYERRYYGYIWHPNYAPQVMVTLVKVEGEEEKQEFLVEFCDNEKEMLTKLINKIVKIDPDYILGWNVEAFDLAYIINRCRKYLGLGYKINEISPLSGEERNPVYIQDFDAIEKRAGGKLSIAKRKRMEFYSKWQVRIKGRVVLDLIKAYKVLYQGVQRDSYRLDDIAQVELGVGKVPLEDTMHNIWMKDPGLLMQYNRRDVELTVRLDEQLGIISHFEQMRKLAGVQIDQILSKITLCKYILLRASEKPLTTERIREHTEEWKGGLLMVPVSVGNNVFNFDLTQLYPNIMIICNISPDTVLGVYKNTEEYENVRDSLEKFKPIVVKGSSGLIYVFRSDVVGLIPSQLDLFIELRELTKKGMLEQEFGTSEFDALNTRQTSYKHTTAAFYGISSLIFEFNLGDPITGVGRETNKWTQDKEKELGYDVIYADTESTFVKAHSKTLDEQIKEGYELAQKLNETYPEFLTRFGPVLKPHRMKIEFKEIHKKIFFKGRRRYASCLVWVEGQKVEPPKLFRIGIESRRSDTSRFSRTLLDRILTDWLIGGQGVTELAKTIKQERENMIGEVYRNEEIGFPSGLERQLEDYKHRNPRVDARKYSNRYFGTKYFRGSHVKILYVTPKFSGNGSHKEKLGAGKVSDELLSGQVKYPPTASIAFQVDEDVPPEFWHTHVINFERMVKRNITNRLEAIFVAEGTTLKDAMSGTVQAKLFASLSGE